MMRSVHPELSQDPGSLSNYLHGVLADLYQHPYPYVPNPPLCKKRASVALILRVRPTYEHWPEPSYPTSAHDHGYSTRAQLDGFFSQSWVEHGEPEVLFIKRASRVGDRWTGHVALPGGKRDPEDSDDIAVAVREAWEEIGLDLSTEECIHVGNLPERVVTSSWGSVPLMVLCPFIFLLTRHDSPDLKLQPTEVASTHWVPLRVLLSPTSRTQEYADVSQRLANQGGLATRLAFRSLVGVMEFSAVKLKPTESLYCNSTPGFLPGKGPPSPPQSFFQRWRNWVVGNQAESRNGQGQPLLLWGLTLGILADFLDMLPPYTAAVQLWDFPTFTAFDLRLIVKAVTHSLRERNTLEVQAGARRPSNAAMDGQTAALPVTETTDSRHNPNAVGIGGLGVGRYYGSTERGPDGLNYAVGILLRGYNERLRVALYVFLLWRMALGSAAAVYAWKLLRRRLSS